MPIIENWYTQGLGVYGSAGWNKYGTALQPAHIYTRETFSVTADGLECTIGSGSPRVARAYTWHGLTVDAIAGSFQMNYRARADASRTVLETAYLVGASADGKSWLYVFDRYDEGTSRTYGWALSHQQDGTIVSYFGTAVNSGAWTMSASVVRVSYLGDGTWEGSFTGVKGGASTTLVSTLTPGASGTFALVNNIGGIAIYNSAPAATGNVLWQCESFRMPYTNCEWTSPSRLAFVGTWDDGSSVGYLPLGEWLVECSDIVSYAYFPLEYRAWSSSVSCKVNDYYDTEYDRWTLRGRVLGDLLGTLYATGSLVFKQTWNGSWSTLFSGPISGEPVYDYVHHTCSIEAESALTHYINIPFSMTRAPWSYRYVGTWGPLYGLGTYSVTHAAATLEPHDLLYATGTPGSYVTIRDVVSRQSNGSGLWSTRFTLYEEGLTPGLHLNASVSTIPAWPSSAQAVAIREAPYLLVENLVANIGLCIEENAAYTAWRTTAAEASLSTLPRIRPTDSVVTVLNEVCAALNTAYTVSPDGRISLFSFEPDPSTTRAILHTEHYSDSYDISTYAPIGSVTVRYSFDVATGEGPQRSLTVVNTNSVPTSSVGAISSRFLGDAVVAIVAGYRAIRRFDGAVPILDLQVEGSRWATEPAGAAVIFAADSDWLGSAALAGSAMWQVCAKSYSYNSDQTTLSMMARYPVRSWVTWGSSIPFNSTKRWF